MMWYRECQHNKINKEAIDKVDGLDDYEVRKLIEWHGDEADRLKVNTKE